MKPGERKEIGGDRWGGGKQGQYFKLPTSIEYYMYLLTSLTFDSVIGLWPTRLFRTLSVDGEMQLFGWFGLVCRIEDGKSRYTYVHVTSTCYAHDVILYPNSSR